MSNVAPARFDRTAPNPVLMAPAVQVAAFAFCQVWAESVRPPTPSDETPSVLSMPSPPETAPPFHVKRLVTVSCPVPPTAPLVTVKFAVLAGAAELKFAVPPDTLVRPVRSYAPANVTVPAVAETTPVPVTVLLASRRWVPLAYASVAGAATVTGPLLFPPAARF